MALQFKNYPSICIIKGTELINRWRYLR